MRAMFLQKNMLNQTLLWISLNVFEIDDIHRKIKKIEVSKSLETGRFQWNQNLFWKVTHSRKMIFLSWFKVRCKADEVYVTNLKTIQSYLAFSTRYRTFYEPHFWNWLHRKNTPNVRVLYVLYYSSTFDCTQKPVLM